MEIFMPRALHLALLARVALLWKTSLGCQMHCSTVDAGMTLNTIVANLRSSCWTALLSPGSSPLLRSVLLRRAHVANLWSWVSWVHRAYFLRMCSLLCWKPHTWESRTRCSKMIPKINIIPQKSVRKSWKPPGKGWDVTNREAGYRQGIYFRNWSSDKVSHW